MAQNKPPKAVKNLVLVHRGFMDGSGWEGVYKALKKNGYNVTVVQNSTTSSRRRRRHHKARDCYAGRPRYSRRSLSMAARHHRSWERSAGGWVVVRCRLRARRGASVSSLTRNPPPGAPVPPIGPPVDGYLMLDEAKFPCVARRRCEPRGGRFHG